MASSLPSSRQISERKVSVALQDSRALFHRLFLRGEPGEALEEEIVGKILFTLPAAADPCSAAGAQRNLDEKKEGVLGRCWPVVPDGLWDE